MCQENKQARYVLLERVPEQLPASHSYQRVDPETFVELTRFITEPLDHEGYILVKSPVSQYVINQIHCGRWARIPYMKMGASFPETVLGPDDYGLVIERARIGFFMGWPSIRGKKNILDRCEFGILRRHSNDLDKPV